MSTNLTPLEVCERLFGDIEVVGVASGQQKKAAYRWRHGSQWREPGEFPTCEIMRNLLAYSRRNGLGLTEKHLIYGAPSDEIDAILNNRSAESRAGGDYASPADAPSKDEAA